MADSGDDNLSSGSDATRETTNQSYVGPNQSDDYDDAIAAAEAAVADLAAAAEVTEDEGSSNNNNNGDGGDDVTNNEDTMTEGNATTADESVRSSASDEMSGKPPSEKSGETGSTLSTKLRANNNRDEHDLTSSERSRDGTIASGGDDDSSAASSALVPFSSVSSEQDNHYRGYTVTGSINASIPEEYEYVPQQQQHQQHYHQQQHRAADVSRSSRGSSQQMSAGTSQASDWSDPGVEAARRRRMETPLEVRYDASAQPAVGRTIRHADDESTIGETTIGGSTLGGSTLNTRIQYDDSRNRYIGDNDESTIGGNTLGESTLGASTIGGNTLDTTNSKMSSNTGASDVSQGWSQYDDDYQSMGSNDSKFFERALPAPPGAGDRNTRRAYGMMYGPHGIPEADAASVGNTIGSDTMESTRSAGWSQYDDQRTASSMSTNQEFFERALPPSTSASGSNTPLGSNVSGSVSGSESQQGTSSYQPGSSVQQGSQQHPINTRAPPVSNTFIPSVATGTIPSGSGGGSGQEYDDGTTLGPSTVGHSAANSSTRSSGWSRYDNDDGTFSSMGTNNEFFERALPPSESSNMPYPGGAGLNAANASASVQQPTSSADAHDFMQNQDPAQMQPPLQHQQDHPEVDGSTMFGLSSNGDSTQSRGWSKYDDNQTYSTMGTNDEFFERALPPSQDAMEDPNFNQQYHQQVARDNLKGNVPHHERQVVAEQAPIPAPMPAQQPTPAQAEAEATAAAIAAGAAAAVGATSASVAAGTYDDDHTIQTYGDGYWNASQSGVHAKKPEDGAGQSFQDPLGAIAEEGDEEEEESMVEGEHEEEPSVIDEKVEKPEKTIEQDEESQLPQEEYSEVSYGASTQQQESHQEFTGNVTKRQSPLYREAVNMRSYVSREVEVSMDGFMHQKKAADDSRTIATSLYSSGFSQQPTYIPPYEFESGPKSKGSRLLKCISILPMALLAAVSLYSCTQLGPFYVKPALTTRVDDIADHQHKGNDNSNTRGEISPSTGGTTGNTPGNTAIVENNDPKFPPEIQVAFLNWRITFDPTARISLPFLWNYAFSGGAVIERIFGLCLGRVQAGSKATFDPDGAYDSWDINGLRVQRTAGNLFVNVDLGTVEGIQRAQRLSFANSNVAEVSYSPLLYQSSTLFQPRPGRTIPDVQGYLMIVFRHPIERSLNRYEEVIKTEPNLSLLDYAKSKIYQEKNPLLRALVNLDRDSEINDDIIKTAKEIIHRKVIVGLYDRMDETVEKFEKYFGWYIGDTVSPVAKCHVDTLDVLTPEFTVSKDYAATDPEGYNLLVAQHRLDLIVYQFAENLFQPQWEHLDADAGKKPNPRQTNVAN